MADIKISEMTKAASLAGQELIPVVQQGVNKIVTVDQIKQGLATEQQITNMLVKTQQTLTPEEQNQVLSNIGIDPETLAYVKDPQQEPVEQPESTTADRAVADKNGNDIVDTYATKKEHLNLEARLGINTKFVVQNEKFYPLGFTIKKGTKYTVVCDRKYFLYESTNGDDRSSQVSVDVEQRVVTAGRDINFFYAYGITGDTANISLAVNGDYYFNRNFYEAVGAVYNAETNTYTLNDVEMTSEEMAAVYEFFNFNSGEMFNKPYNIPLSVKTLIKTNIPPLAFPLNHGNWPIPIKWYYLGSGLTNLEIVNVDSGASDKEFLVSDGYTGCRYFFYNCSKLREIRGVVNISRIDGNLIYFLSGCPALTSVKIKGLKVNWGIKQSPLLSKESILYAIQNSAATSAITITLHPDAYNMAINDTDIQAALEEKEFVSLASA